PTYNAVSSDAGNTVTLTMTVTSDNACSPQTETDSYTISVDPLPTASAGGSETICSNGSATVSGASASNGSIDWTHNGNGSLSDATTLTPTYNAVSSDAGNTVTLTMSVTSDNACSPETATAFYTVNIGSGTTAPNFVSSDENNFCEDDAGTMNLSATGGSGVDVHWFTGSCGGTEIGTGNPLSISTPTSTTTYYARWENSCDVSSCESVTVNVAEPPTAPASATSDINDFCADDSGNIELSISGGSGNTVEWFTGSCGGTSVGTGNPLVLPSPDVTTTYYARWTNVCGSSSCVSHTVNVNPLPEEPTAALSDQAEVCADDAGQINLSVNGGSGDDVHWYTGTCGGTAIGTGNPVSIESPDVTTTYYARWESTCGVSSCETVTVDVIELPTAPDYVSSDDNDFCNGENGSFTLSASGGGGDNLRWFTGNCGGTEIGTGSPLSMNIPEDNTVYYARWENACGVSDCESTEINIIDQPTDPTSAEADVTEICADDNGNISLSLNGENGGTVHWYSGSCGSVAVGTGNPLSIESPTNTTTYYGRYESSCGISGCASVTIHVTAVPESPASAEVNINDLCSNAGETIELSLTGGSGGDVNWYTESCGDTQIGTGNPLSISQPTSTTTYYGRWENSCGVSACQNVTVNILPAADAGIEAAGPFCENDDPLVLTAAESGGTWSGPGVTASTGFFDPEIAGPGEHLISYTIEGNCGDSDEITIEILQAMNAEIKSETNFCSDDPAFMPNVVIEGGSWSGSGIDEDTGIFDPAEAGPGNHQIIYSFNGLCGDADTAIFTVHQRADASIFVEDSVFVSDTAIQLVANNPGGIWTGNGIDESTGEFNPMEAGEGLHTIWYTFDQVCGDTDSTKIVVLPEAVDDLVIPTVLTPNGDGYNDTWRLQGIRDFTTVQINIFNRWGDEVFTFEGTGNSYTDQKNQWDGTRRGKDLPLGSYVYILEINHTTTYKGTVTLIR
ncbi:MAG: gliding motility-associated C-terminal domain-containing protein, partial [Bacteroidota bacterium]